MDALEPFHPDRMASRILGMGDVLTLIEKAESSLDLEKARQMEKKLRKDEFTLDDFLEQIEQVRKLGSLSQIMGMIPGMNKIKQLQNMDFDDKEIKQVIAIIRSMTRKERHDPAIINGSRRKRIALGSGTRVQDVNRLLKQFSEARKMMKKFQGSPKKRQKRWFSTAFHAVASGLRIYTLSRNGRVIL